jgi:hypothetical protein
MLPEKLKMDRERRICHLLNQLSAANIPQDKDALEYFVNDEEETSDVENFDEEDSVHDDHDEADDDAPLVSNSAADTSDIKEASGWGDIDCEYCSVPFPTTGAVSNFACHCTQIKVSTPDQRGCFSQFDPDVIVDFQLTLRGLNRSESASLLFCKRMFLQICKDFNCAKKGLRTF